MIDREETAEILQSIRDIYKVREMTVKDLLSVLYGCGYDKAQAASIVRRALNDRLNGRVVYKNAPRKKMTQKDTVLYLKKI